MNYLASLRFVSSWSGFNLFISSLNDVREITLAANSGVYFLVEDDTFESFFAS